MSSVRGAGLPLRQASEALLLDQGRHEQAAAEHVQQPGISRRRQPWCQCSHFSTELGQDNSQLLKLQYNIETVRLNYESISMVFDAF